MKSELWQSESVMRECANAVETRRWPFGEVENAKYHRSTQRNGKSNGKTWEQNGTTAQGKLKLSPKGQWVTSYH